MNHASDSLSARESRQLPLARPVTARARYARTIVFSALAASMAATGCKHKEHNLPPAPMFAITDKFFDVKSGADGKFVLLGYRSKLTLTGDAGGSFEKVPQPMTQSLTRLSFLDGNTGIGVGHGGKVFGTSDGGKTWTETPSGTESAFFDVDLVSPTRAAAVGDISTVALSGDGGKTWAVSKIELSTIGVREDMSLAISDPIFYSVDFLDENTGWVSGEFGQIRITEDGGKTWGAQHASLLTGENNMYRDVMALPTLLCIRMKNRMEGMAVGTYGSIIFTTDGGQTWVFAPTPISTPLYDIQFTPDGNAVLVGSSGVILKGNPRDGFKQTSVPEGVFTWISALDFDSTGKGIAVGGHGLVLTTGDFGNTWEWKIG